MPFNREAKEKEDRLAFQVPRVLAEPREIRSVSAGTSAEAHASHMLHKYYPLLDAGGSVYPQKKSRMRNKPPNEMKQYK